MSQDWEKSLTRFVLIVIYRLSYENSWRQRYWTVLKLQYERKQSQFCNYQKSIRCIGVTPRQYSWNIAKVAVNPNSNMTSFKRFESKPVVKIIFIYDRSNLWRHRQFITVFYQFLHIRIEIIHGSHMYILFLPRVGLYVSFLPLAIAWGKISWHKGLPVVKTIYTYGFHELFLNQSINQSIRCTV
jgi:hypothetical protein